MGARFSWRIELLSPNPPYAIVLFSLQPYSKHRQLGDAFVGSHDK
jgi:hypothetical protein